MPSKKHLIIIGGPTASGKTTFAIKLAQHFKTEILSADSRQFYQEMNIGTAKPEYQELSQAPHHLINNLSIKDNYSVGRFESDALALLNDLYQKQDIAILVGGSGLYIKALCEGLDLFPEVPVEIREEVEEIYQKKGLSPLQEELKRVDPVYYSKVDVNNPHRLIRALAVYKTSGQAFSVFQNQKQIQRPFLPIYLQLQWPRPVLYERIDQRVDLMIEAGLEEEARQLLPYQTHSTLQTVGYQELFEYFAGNYTLEEAIKLIKRNSRRYAKRQLTWNRRDGFWKHLMPNDFEIALKYIELARNQDFSIRIHPFSKFSAAPLLPLKVALAKTQESSKWLCASQKDQIQLLLLKEELFKVTCFSHFSAQEESPDSIILDLFAHETALQAEDQNTYLLIPPTLKLFFHKYGFQDTTLESIPNKIRSRWTALQFLGNQIIMQKPAL